MPNLESFRSKKSFGVGGYYLLLEGCRGRVFGIDFASITPSCCDDNYNYSDYRGTYVHYEDYDEDDDEYPEQEDSGAYNYEHRVEDDLGFKLLPHEKHSKDTIYYGVELEVERRKDCPYDMPHYIMDSVLNGFAQCKSDCSLDNGFEITTAPAGS